MQCHVLLTADFQWAQSSYTVNEGEGSVQVCLEIAPNRVLPKGVSVELHTPWDNRIFKANSREIGD